MAPKIKLSGTAKFCSVGNIRTPRQSLVGHELPSHSDPISGLSLLFPRLVLFFTGHLPSKFDGAAGA